MMRFPLTRLRRLRNNPAIRNLVSETRLSVSDFVYPMFIRPGQSIREPIPAMDGCFHLSPDIAVAEAKEIADLGISAVLLFGITDKKDPTGSESCNPNNAVAQSIQRIKDAVPGLAIITDVCLCAYTEHGHCGVIENGKIENDKTGQLLAQMAAVHATAGADIVAPSDMMDGRVGIIRKALDEKGQIDTAIMAYSAKFASAFYGPFRNAAESSPAFGDRKTYQLDCANPRQAMREIELDIEEGADMVMIKPASVCLDIIRMAKDRFDVPIAAYHVSGEYMMVKTAAKAGLIDERQAMLEMLIGIKRAGADIIITYFAKSAAMLLG